MSSFACPRCSGSTDVKDSRPRLDGGIRRRRVCADCGNRFTTFEVLSGDDYQVLAQLYSAPPIVVKQSAELVGLMPALSTEDRIVLMALAHRLSGRPVQSIRVLAMGRAAGRAVRHGDEDEDDAPEAAA